MLNRLSSSCQFSLFRFTVVVWWPFAGDGILHRVQCKLTYFVGSWVEVFLFMIPIFELSGLLVISMVLSTSASNSLAILGSFFHAPNFSFLSLLHSRVYTRPKELTYSVDWGCIFILIASCELAASNLGTGLEDLLYRLCEPLVLKLFTLKECQFRSIGSN